MKNHKKITLILIVSICIVIGCTFIIKSHIKNNKTNSVIKQSFKPEIKQELLQVILDEVDKDKCDVIYEYNSEKEVKLDKTKTSIVLLENDKREVFFSNLDNDNKCYLIAKEYDSYCYIVSFINYIDNCMVVDDIVLKNADGTNYNELLKEKIRFSNNRRIHSGKELSDRLIFNYINRLYDGLENVFNYQFYLFEFQGSKGDKDYYLFDNDFESTSQIDEVTLDNRTCTNSALIDRYIPSCPVSKYKLQLNESPFYYAKRREYDLKDTTLHVGGNSKLSRWELKRGTSVDEEYLDFGSLCTFDCPANKDNIIFNIAVKLLNKGIFKKSTDEFSIVIDYHSNTA